MEIMINLIFQNRIDFFFRNSFSLFWKVNNFQQN